MTNEAVAEQPVADFTIEEGRTFLADFETRLNDYVPNPTARRLVSGEVEYTPEELTGMLQAFSGYIASLSGLLGKMEAEDNIMKKGYRNTLRIAVAGFQSRANSVSGKEAEFLASDEGATYRKVAGDIIKQESCMMLTRGWLKAYESAYTGISRVITVMESEANAT